MQWPLCTSDPLDSGGTPDLRGQAMVKTEKNNNKYFDAITCCSRRGWRRNRAAVNRSWERRLHWWRQREHAQHGHTHTHIHANNRVEKGWVEPSAIEWSREREGGGATRERRSSHAGSGAQERYPCGARAAANCWRAPHAVHAREWERAGKARDASPSKA